MTNAEAILLCVDQGLIAFPVKTPRPPTSGRRPRVPAKVYAEVLAYVESHPGLSMRRAAGKFGVSYDMVRKYRQKIRKAKASEAANIKINRDEH